MSFQVLCLFHVKIKLYIFGMLFLSPKTSDLGLLILFTSSLLLFSCEVSKCIIFVRIDAIERFSSVFFILDMGMK